jgi:hypothetical protein
VVHAMDPPDIYPYKRHPTQKLFAAFCDMLKRKAYQYQVSGRP